MPRPTPDIPAISPFYLRWFTWYGRRYVRKNFHALRISKAGPAPPLDDSPAIVYLNHPSWWDPMIGLAIASKAYTDRTHYAPMDDRALAKYRFFSKLGFFPVRPDSRRGAVSLLRHGAAILAQPNSTLWLTPQGHFTDVRARPTEFRPGIGHLARRIERGMAVPMALEVTFWNERSPEALVRFGDPIDFDGAHRDDSSADWTGRLERALEVTQDALAEEVMRRRPNDFETLLGGRAGVGGVYDIWRRFKAALHGRAFHPEHDREAP